MAVSRLCSISSPPVLERLSHLAGVPASSPRPLPAGSPDSYLSPSRVVTATGLLASTGCQGGPPVWIALGVGAAAIAARFLIPARLERRALSRPIQEVTTGDFCRLVTFYTAPETSVERRDWARVRLITLIRERGEWFLETVSLLDAHQRKQLADQFLEDLGRVVDEKSPRFKDLGQAVISSVSVPYWSSQRTQYLDAIAAHMKRRGDSREWRELYDSALAGLARRLPADIEEYWAALITDARHSPFTVERRTEALERATLVVKHFTPEQRRKRHIEERIEWLLGDLTFLKLEPFTDPVPVAAGKIARAVLDTEEVYRWCLHLADRHGREVEEWVEATGALVGSYRVPPPANCRFREAFKKVAESQIVVLECEVGVRADPSVARRIASTLLERVGSGPLWQLVLIADLVGMMMTGLLEEGDAWRLAEILAKTPQERLCGLPLYPLLLAITGSLGRHFREEAPSRGLGDLARFVESNVPFTWENWDGYKKAADGAAFLADLASRPDAVRGRYF